MLEVKFKIPTDDDIRFIADNMRDEDVEEVWATAKFTPLEALHISMKKSFKSTVVKINEVPVAILGITLPDYLSDTGIPWLLSTHQALNYKRKFIELSSPILNEMLDIRPKLVNHVHAKNKLSIRWLKRLGFTIEDPEINILTGELFHRFHMTR